MFTDFFAAIAAYGKAVQMISQLRLWKYLLIPGLLSLALALLIGGLAWGFYDNLGELLLFWMPEKPGDGFWGRLLQKTAGLLTGVSYFIGGLLILALGVIFYKNLVMVVVAPFMSPLAQKVEEQLTGKTTLNPGFRMSRAISDFSRGLRIALRNIFREIFYVLLLLLLGLVPVVGLLSTLGIFLVQAFYAGFGNMDYTLERHFSVKESVRFVRNHRGLAMGNGTVFLLLLSIGVGFLIAPPLATVAATIETVKRLKNAEVDLLDSELV